MFVRLNPIFHLNHKLSYSLLTINENSWNRIKYLFGYVNDINDIKFIITRQLALLAPTHTYKSSID